ncbi:DUF2510 domain-containing protein [Acidipropionibacterium timonense]|uniref:DUF2510 domain-containing protein n=1 Tax=Acidipropionibacterium timonense TaxID=2161818 RepID=UPI0014368348|nr:DUF2510 domain-containing protein [Acidipropionibacterium timonense]
MAPAGWYPDPSGAPGRLRHWDGVSWSAETMDAPAGWTPSGGDSRSDRPPGRDPHDPIVVGPIASEPGAGGSSAGGPNASGSGREGALGSSGATSPAAPPFVDPHRSRRIAGWVASGVAVLVLVAIVVVLATRGGAPQDTGSATPSSAPATTTPDGPAATPSTPTRTPSTPTRTPSTPASSPSTPGANPGTTTPTSPLPQSCRAGTGATTRVTGTQYSAGRLSVIPSDRWTSLVSPPRFAWLSDRTAVEDASGTSGMAIGTLPASSATRLERDLSWYLSCLTSAAPWSGAQYREVDSSDVADGGATGLETVYLLISPTGDLWTVDLVVVSGAGGGPTSSWVGWFRTSDDQGRRDVGAARRSLVHS